jgi:hypothetical protein
VLSATSHSLNRGQVLSHLVTNGAPGENGASGTLNQHQLQRNKIADGARMSLWDRMRGGAAGSGVRRRASTGDSEHLRAWAGVRIGVEAFVEPRTMVTETTVVLVAKDGEWTRRRVSGPPAARKLARSLGIPIYDVQVLGYPKRMRDYDARQRVLRDRERRREFDR